MALAERNLRSYEIQIDFYGAGPAEVGLKALAGHLSLKNVHFRGFATDIEKLWDEYHALVMPSRFEGLPLALIEAMLCHRAAVVTDVGGNCEYVEDGITGFVVEAPVPSALNRGLIRCWQSREKLKEMGELAGSRVRQLVPAEPARVFANRLMCLL
jgi:glycosyltransferase involved in cell wall biosynthesis